MLGLNNTKEISIGDRYILKIGYFSPKKIKMIVVDNKLGYSEYRGCMLNMPCRLRGNIQIHVINDGKSSIGIAAPQEEKIKRC